MKIMLESTTIFPVPPAGYAGTEMVVYNLAIELTKLGHQVSVAAPIGSKFPPGIEHIPTVEPAWDANREDLAWPIVLNRLVQNGVPTKEFDIVHCHSFRMWPYMAAKDHKDVHVCATIHWQMHWPMLPQIQAGQVPLLPIVPKANFIGLSNVHALHISGALGVPVEYVHNGVRLEAYPFKKEKGDRFLFLGRMAPFKGAHIAIDLADKYGFPLDVAGEDRLVGQPQYVLQVSNACNRMARYHGEVPHEKKLELLQNAKAVLCPYIWAEPFGLVPIEANAVGTPAIGLYYPGSALAEIIKDGVNGFLVNSPPEMGEVMKNVGDIKPEECRAFVEEKFTAALQAQRYEALYERVISHGGW